MSQTVEVPIVGQRAGDAVRSVQAQLTGAATVVVRAADLIVAPRALTPVTRDLQAGTAVLVRPGGSGNDVRVRHHMVMAVGSHVHEIRHPDRQLVGVLAITASDQVAAHAALTDLAQALDDGDIADPAGDVFTLIVLALVRSVIPVRAIDMVDVPWFRSPADPVEAERLIGEVSDRRIARLQANRIDDGFYSTFIVRKLSKPVTALALRLGISPNTITMVSFVLGIAAAAGFAMGQWGWILAGAILLQLSLVIDCVDGEVARSTGKFSALGAWLDASTDRVKELLVYAGLAIGAVQAGAWSLAVILVVVQTTRHMMDYNFAAVQRRREAVVTPRDIRILTDDGDVGGWSVQGALEFSSNVNRHSAVRWAKKVLHMPIGERWLLLSVVAVLAGPWWALLALLTAGCVALLYVSIGRIARTTTWQGSSPADIAQMLSRQADSGPVLTVLSRHHSTIWSRPFGWSLPAILRFLELGTAAAIGVIWFPDLLPLVFAWMAIVAFHDYDLLYRALQGAAMPTWITQLGLGWDGRTLLLVITGILGVIATVLGVGVIWLAAILVVVASVQWLTSMRVTA
jgi:phosphatidylglycerophosphate synthase